MREPYLGGVLPPPPARLRMITGKGRGGSQSSTALSVCRRGRGGGESTRALGCGERDPPVGVHLSIDPDAICSGACYDTGGAISAIHALGKLWRSLIDEMNEELAA